MAVVEVLRLQEICIALQLVLLIVLLPLLPGVHASPCPTTVGEMIVTNTSDAEKLSQALQCDGSARFAVSWHGDVILSRTLSVSNGSTLNVVGSSERMDDTDTGATVRRKGTAALFEIGLGSTVSLTGLALSGGDGALRVTGKSFIELIDCIFIDNNRTSSQAGDDLRRSISFQPQLGLHPWI
ncbi:unnamed protein product [Ascophyllum nodosum]